MTTQSQSNGSSLSHDLQHILATHRGSSIALKEIIHTVGDRGFGIIIVLLALPSALPIPATGYSTPFGLLLAVLALQLCLNRNTLWLPQWALKTQIPHKFASKVVQWAIHFLAKIEFLIKPRYAWATGFSGKFFAGAIILIMACLMILPIPGTNTFPAFVIFLVGVGLTEKDGLFFLVATLLGLLTSVFYGVIIYFFVTLGVEATMNMIKSLVMFWKS